jgi:microcystin degradation protein MlrC
MAPFSVHQLLGLWHSLSVRAVVIKGVHAPVAAYAPICSRRLRVNTPGATSADLTQFVYHHRRRPMFPLEPDTVRGEI